MKCACTQPDRAALTPRSAILNSVPALRGTWASSASPVPLGTTGTLPTVGPSADVCPATVMAIQRAVMQTLVRLVDHLGKIWAYKTL